MRRSELLGWMVVGVFWLAVVAVPVKSQRAADVPRKRQTGRAPFEGWNEADGWRLRRGARNLPSNPEVRIRSPLGYLLDADANWWKIYLTEGDLVDHVFAAISEAATPYDEDSRRFDELAIRKAEARLQSHEDEAHSYFYEGLAYGLRSRLEALRDHALATAHAGKKMRNLSLEALKADPSLADADFGLGLYNLSTPCRPT